MLGWGDVHIKGEPRAWLSGSGVCDEGWVGVVEMKSLDGCLGGWMLCSIWFLGGKSDLDIPSNLENNRITGVYSAW